MKKVMLSALVAGMFLIGSAYAQTTTPATGKQTTTQDSKGAAKTDKPAKTNKKGKGKKAGGKKAATTTPKSDTQK